VNRDKEKHLVVNRVSKEKHFVLLSLILREFARHSELDTTVASLEIFNGAIPAERKELRTYSVHTYLIVAA